MNGITDHSPMFNGGGSVNERKRLLKVVRRYNSNFTDEDLNNIVQTGTLDFFGEATKKTPSNYIERQDSVLMQELLTSIRSTESYKSGGEIEKPSKYDTKVFGDYSVVYNELSEGYDVFRVKDNYVIQSTISLAIAVETAEKENKANQPIEKESKEDLELNQLIKDTILNCKTLPHVCKFRETELGFSRIESRMKEHIFLQGLDDVDTALALVEGELEEPYIEPNY